MAADIKIVRGTTQALEIDLKDAAGDHYTLGEGEKLVFGVKSNPNNTSFDIKKTLTAEDAQDNGKYKISLSPTDTSVLPIGTYWYDIGLQTATDYYMVVPISKIELTQNVTKMEVG